MGACQSDAKGAVQDVIVSVRDVSDAADDEPLPVGALKVFTEDVKLDLKQDFVLGRVLGKGQFGTVRQVTERATGARYACKSIAKRRLCTATDVEDVRREVQIMHHLSGHPNIVQLKDVYEDRGYVHMVEELCTGGELFDSILERGKYSERDAAGVFRSIAAVIAHCHNMGVMHRDIKPENFLLSAGGTGGSSVVKGTDFGLSCFFSEGQSHKEVVGSALYVAPEVLRKRYDKRADVWSLGVLLYILLCGEPPFYAETERAIFQAILTHDLDFSSEPWPSISGAAKDVIRRMLDRNVATRISAADVLQHEWVRVDGSAAEAPLQHEVLVRLQNFAALNKLQQEALKVIATHLPENEISGLKALFQEMDADGSGSITVEELREALRKKGTKIPQEELERIMAQADISGDGTLDYEEFLAATMNLAKLEHEEHLYMAFRFFDADDSGFITMDELHAALHRVCSREEIEELMRQADTSGDGRIDYEEFCDLMRSGNSALARATRTVKQGLMRTVRTQAVIELDQLKGPDAPDSPKAAPARAPSATPKPDPNRSVRANRARLRSTGAVAAVAAIAAAPAAAFSPMADRAPGERSKARAMLVGLSMRRSHGAAGERSTATTASGCISGSPTASGAAPGTQSDWNRNRSGLTSRGRHSRALRLIEAAEEKYGVGSSSPREGRVSQNGFADRGERGGLRSRHPSVGRNGGQRSTRLDTVQSYEITAHSGALKALDVDSEHGGDSTSPTRQSYEASGRVSFGGLLSHPQPPSLPQPQTITPRPIAGPSLRSFAAVASPFATAAAADAEPPVLRLESIHHATEYEPEAGLIASVPPLKTIGAVASAPAQATTTSAPNSTAAVSSARAQSHAVPQPPSLRSPTTTAGSRAASQPSPTATVAGLPAAAGGGGAGGSGAVTPKAAAAGERAGATSPVVHGMPAPPANRNWPQQPQPSPQPQPAAVALAPAPRPPHHSASVGTSGRDSPAHVRGPSQSQPGNASGLPLSPTAATAAMVGGGPRPQRERDRDPTGQSSKALLGRLSQQQDQGMPQTAASMPLPTSASEPPGSPKSSALGGGGGGGGGASGVLPLLQGSPRSRRFPTGSRVGPEDAEACKGALDMLLKQGPASGTEVTPLELPTIRSMSGHALGGPPRSSSSNTLSSYPYPGSPKPTAAARLGR
ncbi:hypothetical protein HYH03_011775 [Edaphochlamys debaryana]|uniref:non-specific serine/threonine protein kinase n=1 Tax=Edaphochlamys debaryana TaxID=47281 RepID=A0A835XSX5_9CHLO|nr:hypothetical protein HYH03_011775 [Edaphochlamys debaryana]|eukprot:KAG2489663.1 hypothetical protein HYH03_011775 [Edaphochlamys debaryana]